MVGEVEVRIETLEPATFVLADLVDLPTSLQSRI
jgi:hypothetical protein